MNPTLQKAQKPSKAFGDAITRGVGTYLSPAIASLVLMLSLHLNGLDTSMVAIVGTVTFWLIAFEATNTYFRVLVIPRSVDIQADPSDAVYLGVLLGRVVYSVAIAAFIGAAPAFLSHFISAPPVSLSLLTALTIWVLVGLRELAVEESHGKPRLASGAVGNRLKPQSLAAPLANKLWANNHHSLRWGGVKLGMGELIKNFLFVGSVGSGKTLALKQWLEELLPNVEQHRNWRALIVDPKSEFYPWLIGFLRPYKVKLLSPTDARTCVWDMSRDLNTPEAIFEASNLLIPKSPNETQPFFSNAARRLLYGMMISLNLTAPSTWQLSDLVYALRSRRRMQTLLSLHPESRDIYNTYAANDRVLADVFATLDAAIQELLPTAAHWSHLIREAPHKLVALTDWVRQNYVLLLSKRASNDTAESGLISLIVKRVSQLLLDGPTAQSTMGIDTARRTIVAIDEAPRAGHLDVIDLATNGRDYGIAVALSTTSVEAIRNNFAKPDEFDAVANEFHSAVFLQSNGPNTARWMSERIGQVELVRRPDNGPAETSWHSTIEPTVFQTLAQGQSIGPHRVPGIYLNTTLGVWYCEGPVHVSPPRPGIPGRVPALPRPLRPWDDEDLRRLNLLTIKDQLALDEPEPPSGNPPPSGNSPAPGNPPAPGSPPATGNPPAPGSIQPPIRRFRV